MPDTVTSKVGNPIAHSPRRPAPARIPNLLTLAGRSPGARRSLWLRQGSQRQRGSGALQSTPTARSQHQPPTPARSTRHTALPTRAACGDPRARPPLRPQRAPGLASGAGPAVRDSAARRPAGDVLGPPRGRRGPGVPARPPEPRARGPEAPRGRPARADGGRTAGAGPRLPRCPGEGARQSGAGTSRQVAGTDASPSGAAPAPRQPTLRQRLRAVPAQAQHTPTTIHTNTGTHTAGRSHCGAHQLYTPAETRSSCVPHNPSPASPSPVPHRPLADPQYGYHCANLWSFSYLNIPTSMGRNHLKYARPLQMPPPGDTHLTTYKHDGDRHTLSSV